MPLPFAPPTLRRLALGLAMAAGVAIGTAAAGPITSAHFASDADFQAYLLERAGEQVVRTAFVAQARSGDNTTRGDYEVGLHVAPGFTSVAPLGTPGQLVWGGAGGANAFVPFSLGRIGSTLTFAMGSYTASITDALVAALDALSLRARSVAPGSGITASRTTVRNLAIDGQALPTAPSVAANGSVDLLLIDSLTGDFRLTGEAALDWTGSFPRGTRLGFEIRGLDGVTPIPEPSALLALLTGIGALALLRRRTQRNAAATASA